MDYAEMLDWHLSRHADITIATIQVPRKQASRFGVAEIEQDYQVLGFEEKPEPENAACSGFNPEMVSASMGIYIFNTALLVRALLENAEDPASAHDFGRDILPKWLSRARVIAYDFRDLNDKTVSLLAGCGNARRLLRGQHGPGGGDPGVQPVRPHWPIRTRQLQHPPAKFVFAQEGRRMGVAMDSIVSAGCIVSGGRVIRSVLSPGVRVNSYCEVDSSILMHDVDVGRHSRIRSAIIDTGVKIPEGSLIGFDLDEDRPERLSHHRGRRRGRPIRAGHIRYDNGLDLFRSSSKEPCSWK